MPKKAKPFPLLTAAAIKRMAVERRHHFVNKNALRLNKSLGDAVGMTEMGVHLVRIMPATQPRDNRNRSECERKRARHENLFTCIFHKL